MANALAIVHTSAAMVLKKACRSCRKYGFVSIACSGPLFLKRTPVAHEKQRKIPGRPFS